MSPALDFEHLKLSRFLTDKFGVHNNLTIQRISGGQSNPTYFVTYGDQDMVLRKQPNGPILRGAHAVDREFRVQKAIFKTGVPIAKPILYHGEPDVVGTPFYLMERVQGRVFEDCALPDVPAAERHALWMGLADAMAAMHAVDPMSIGLGDYGKPGNYFERQINRWSRQWDESPHEPIPELDTLHDWLIANQPIDDGAISIAHGDFRMGNVIFHPDEPRVVAILDWELSTIGNPLADLGFCTLAWHTTPDEYGGILGLNHDALGLPSEAEFIDRYMAQRTDSAPLTTFHKAFALFRFSVIWVGVADRVRLGTAAEANALIHDGMAGKLAIRGMELVNCDK